MPFAITKTELSRILPLRTLYLQETNFQKRDGPADDPSRRTVFEFYVIPPFRRQAGTLFRELLAVSGAHEIECQSNDLLLAHLLFELGQDITSDTILFGAPTITYLTYPGGVVRPRREDDRIFEHTVEPEGPMVLEANGEIIATGGAFTHYNPPFADVFMEVAPAYRRTGAGSYLVQEVIKACFLEGRVPAARTGIDNVGSRATLTKAGFAVVGFLLVGRVKR
jgi:GNAT superfamily N-acetyltransferase